MQVGSVINGPVTINYEKTFAEMPKKKVFKQPQKTEKKEDLEGKKIDAFVEKS